MGRFHGDGSTLAWRIPWKEEACITAVTLFYGTITFIYVMPKSSYSTDQNKVVSVFYMVVIPMLNPLIYSLRNNEIKGALKRAWQKNTFVVKPVIS